MVEVASSAANVDEFYSENDSKDQTDESGSSQHDKEDMPLLTESDFSDKVELVLEINDNQFLATSTTNFRRRELMGLPENPMTIKKEKVIKKP